MGNAMKFLTGLVILSQGCLGAIPIGADPSVSNFCLLFQRLIQSLMQGLQRILFSLKASNGSTNTMATISKWDIYWHLLHWSSLLFCYGINRLNVPLVVAITWIFRQSPQKSSIVSFTSLGATWRAVEQQMEEARSWTTTPISVITSGFTRCFLFHLHSPHSSTYKLPFLTVFPCRLWQGLRRIAPNRVVSSIPRLWKTRMVTCTSAGLDSLRIIFYRAGSTAGHRKVSLFTCSKSTSLCLTHNNIAPRSVVHYYFDVRFWNYIKPSDSVV